jgi:hypothetical protein
MKFTLKAVFGLGFLTFVVVMGMQMFPPTPKAETLDEAKTRIPQSLKAVASRAIPISKDELNGKLDHQFEAENSASAEQERKEALEHPDLALKSAEEQLKENMDEAATKAGASAALKRQIFSGLDEPDTQTQKQ